MRRMLLASVLSLPAFAAQAQDPSAGDVTLPERVVTATRVPTLAELIPAGVSVIDRQTMDTRGYTTLPQALEAVPGLHVVQSGGQGGNASVFIRGTNSNNVLVLRDGVPLNDPSDPNGAYNFGVDTLADIDRIEVVRGPMSGLYGSGAIGGVINLITRQGSGGPHATAEAFAGLPQAAFAAGSLYGAEGMVDYNLAVESRSQIGFDATPQRESVYTGERDGYRSQLITLNLGVTPIEGTRFYGFLRYRSSVFGLDELGSPAFDAPDYTGRDSNFTGRVGVTSKLFDGKWETGLSVAQINTYRNYSELLEPADPNATSGLTKYEGRRTAILWSNTVHPGDLGPAKASALTFGVEHRLDGVTSSLDQGFGGFPYVSTTVASGNYTGANAGLQTTLWNRLTASAAVREEVATYGGNAFTGRLGGVLAVPEIWSRLKASWGTAFLAPSLFQLFGVDSYGFVGNPNLQPERSQGWETGWAVDVPALGRRDAASVEVTYFANQITNLIQVVYAPDYSSSTTENVASARTSGVEASMTLRPGDWGEAVLSWTYTDARSGTGAPLLRRPRNQGSASLRLTPLEGLTIAPEIVYVSGASDYLVGNDGFPAGTGLTRAGVLFNLAANYKVLPNVTLFANARNISNSKYEPASGFQTPGPNFLAGARVRF